MIVLSLARSAATALNRLTRRQGHLVIQDAVRVAFDERETDPPHRRLNEPLPVHVLDGVAEPGSPLGQVRRITAYSYTFSIGRPIRSPRCSDCEVMRLMIADPTHLAPGNDERRLRAEAPSGRRRGD
jgi:hypothetical protein